MELNFRELGQGAPLLILHGLFGSSDNWQTIAKQLANDYRVFLIDQRNHGQSPHSNEWNYTAMANDIEEFCMQQQLDHIYIAGHSMGGKTVMKLAELFPNRILKMMVIDIAPRYYALHHQTILAALNSLDFTQVKSRKEAENQLQQSIDDIGTRQFLLKNLYWVNDGELNWRFNLDAITNNIEIVGEATPADLNQICHTPTLFIKGEKSNYISDKDVVQIKQLYPNSELVSIANAGHWVHAENPLALYNAMKGFFA